MTATVESWIGRVLLLVMIGLSFWVWRTDPEGQPRFDRLLAYDASDEVLFRLEHDDSLELTLWLAWPSAWARDARATRPIRIELQTLAEGGQPLRTEEAWIRFRRGRVWLHGDIRISNRLASEQDDEAATLSDDRRWYLDSDFLAGAVAVRLRPMDLSPDDQLLVTAAQQVERTAMARTRARLVAQGNEFLGGRSRLLDEKRRHTSVRLTAIPQPGAPSHPTVPVLTAKVRTPWSDAAALGVPLFPGGALAYTFDQQAIIDLTWTLPDGTPSDPVTTQVRWVSAEGVIREPDTTTAALQLWHTGGLATLQVALGPDAPGPRVLRVRTSGSTFDRSYGDPARLWVDEALTDQWTGPDLRSIEAYPVTPFGTPVAFPVEAGEEIRLSVRTTLTGLPLPGLGPSPGFENHVDVTVLDVNGQEIAAFSEPLYAAVSPYERLVQGGKLPVAICEPASLLLRVPPAAAALRVSTERPALVTLRARDPRIREALVSQGYELDEAMSASSVRMRYQPKSRDPWRARAPSPYEELAKTQRIHRVDAVVRLEPAGSRTSLAMAEARHPLPLDGPYQLLAERGTAVLPAGAPGARTRIAPTATVHVPANGRLWFDYRIDPGQVGQRLQVDVGGVAHERSLAAPAGSFHVDTPARGRTRVQANVKGLLLARAAGSTPWRVRTVYALAPGRTLTLPAVAPGSLAVYPYSSDAVVLGWKIDIPDAEAGLVRRLSDDEGVSALALDRERPAYGLSAQLGSLYRARGAVIRLGDDLRGEGHLTLTNLGKRTTYLRVSASWASPAPPSPQHRTLTWSP